MDKLKEILNNLISSLGKAMVVIALVFMLAIMSIWTVGLIYVSSEAGCVVEDNRVVCEIIRGKE